MEDIEKKFFTKKEAAEILGFHPRTIERYLLAGKLKGARLGKLWKISMDDINEFYEAAKKETAKDIQDKKKDIQDK